MEVAETDFGFFPDAPRARLIDAKIRSGLADSLDAACAALGNRAALAELTAAIRQHQVRPGVMALYGELIPAMMAQDEIALDGILGRLGWPEWRARAACRVVTLDDALLGPGMAECYRRHLQDDPENFISIAAVDDGALVEGKRRIDDALRLLGAAAPALRAEIGVLINEILLVASPPARGALGFHGASSFFIWGALALNLAEHGSRVKLVEGIVHEAGHCLLHGFALGGALTANVSDARHVSPLRDDPRPMEGLVHAAYVLARMHLAMGALLQPGLLEAGHITAAEQAEAKTRFENAARNFWAANETIISDAEFTPVGKAVFARAQDYMHRQWNPAV